MRPRDPDAAREEPASGHPAPLLDGRRVPPTPLLLVVFGVVGFAMTFRSIGRLDTHVVGDSGDAILIQWTLGWVQHAIPHGWSTIWNTNIFFPAHDTLAYADALIPVAIAHWPLSEVLGPVLGFNLLLLAAETAGLWCMYRLALRLTGSWPASFVAAFAFAFATPRLQLVWHPQLMVTGFFVPLIMLLVVRFFDRPTATRGAAIGVALGLLAASSSYYGAMMAVAIPVVALGYLIVVRPPALARVLKGLALGAAVAAVITLPVALRYIDLQQNPHFRRGVEPAFQAHPRDFVSPVPDNLVLAEIPPFDGWAARGGVESHLFPGIIAVVFGAIGLVVVLRVVRRRSATDVGPDSADDARLDALFALLIALAGLALLVLALGDTLAVFGVEIPMPFRLVRKVIPGFAGIRVTSRFVLMTQCALALLAAFGVRALLTRLDRRVGLAAVALLSALIVVETARELPTVRVPGGQRVEAVNEVLKRRPSGVVVELPITSVSDGVRWAYLESPRQYLSLIDTKPRVNGYSGFEPEGFDRLVDRLNTFPSLDSLGALERHDVRYVVLRLRVVGDQAQAPAVAAELATDRVGRYSRATAEEILADIPTACLRRIDRVPGAALVELRSSGCRPDGS